MDVTALDIYRSFDGLEVLRGFSHVFPKGSATCITGPSGCGKTTLLNILMGLLPPDSGSVSGVSGRRAGAVFQEDRLCENLSVISNIRLVCPPGVSKSGIESALERVGLEGAAHRPARELSGGMKRRACLVRAVMSGPEIIFLDEPFKGLDTESKRRAMDYLLESRAGATVILVTHDVEDAYPLGAELLELMI